MTSTKKLFIVAPCLAMGGMERASVNTANGFANLGYQVYFLSIFKKQHFFHLDSTVILIEPKGFNVDSLNLLRSITWIRKSIEEVGPDAVLSIGKLYGAITALALLGLNHKFFVSERSSPFFRWPTRLKVIHKIAYSLNPPTGVIAQTSIAKNFQENYYKYSQIEVIPNSVRKVKLHPGLPRENFVLAVGRLRDHLKGFDRLIEAFAQVNNKKWRLVLAGGDEDGEDLKGIVRSLNLDDRVDFLGKVKDLDSIYARAGIFVIPSHSEGFPNALCEAMAAGVPCVAYDFTAGPADIIKDGINGLIVENGNTEKMAACIDYLIINPDLRADLGRNALKIQETLSLENIITKMENFIFDS